MADTHAECIPWKMYPISLKIAYFPSTLAFSLKIYLFYLNIYQYLPKNYPFFPFSSYITEKPHFFPQPSVGSNINFIWAWL